MAQVKYQCEFYSNNGIRYRINIYHVDYTGSIVEFKGGMDGFKLKYEGTNDPEYKSIKASSLEFDFLIEQNPVAVGTPTTGNIYGDLLGNNESKLFVILQHYDTSDTTWINSWAGDVIDDTVTIADQPLPTRIRIRATDGVAKMKQKIYSPKTGASWLCVLYYFQEAIEQTIYYSTMFPSSGGTSTISIRNTSNRFQENMGSITDSTWKDTYNPYKLAFINEAAFKKDNGEFMTYYDIINQIATLYGVQFFQSYKYNENQGGCWWIFSRYVMYNESTSSVTSSCRIFNNQAYKSDGTALTEYEYAIPNTSVLNTFSLDITQDIGLDLDTDRPKLKGNKISYLAPLGRVFNNYYHDLISYPLNMPNTNPDQYSNITCLGGGGGGIISFFDNSASATVAGQLNSPTFPADMPYTGSDTSFSANNNGWFIPITAGQDCIAITGNVTVTYKFSWSYAALDTLLSGENSFIDTTFKIPLRFVPIISNKSASDYAQAQIDGVDLGDSEIRRFLDGTFGSNGSPIATWSSTVTDFDNPATPFVTINLDNPPLENDTEMTLTIPFGIMTEELPTPHVGVTNYLKRFEYSVSNFSNSKMFSGAFFDLIDNGTITMSNFNFQITDLRTSLIFDGSTISNYFGYEKGLFSNFNTDASAQMEIKPDFFIGDPPSWIGTAAGGTSETNLAPTQYFGGIRIHAPSASNPTTTFPNQIQVNNGDWITENDSTEKNINKLLCREIIKKRCVPAFKYDIKIQPQTQAKMIGFWNTFKINMRLNNDASDDIRGFFPIGGTYTAMTNTWHFHLQQMDINTETNIQDDSYIEPNFEPFENNPNILIQVDN